MSAPIEISYGEHKRREAAAKEKAERRKVSPEVRAARAALLERREAAREASEAETKAERDAMPNALRTVLSRGTPDELAEISRKITRLDGRQIQSLVNEVFRDKTRTGYRSAPESTVEAPPARRASSGRREA